MAEFRAVAMAKEAIGMLPTCIVDGVKVMSGWMPTEELALAELDYFMEKQLPAGCYHVQTIIERR